MKDIKEIIDIELTTVDEIKSAALSARLGMHSLSRLFERIKTDALASPLNFEERLGGRLSRSHDTKYLTTANP
jgi:hypothetical protein